MTRRATGAAHCFCVVERAVDGPNALPRISALELPLITRAERMLAATPSGGRGMSSHAARGRVGARVAFPSRQAAMG